MDVLYHYCPTPAFHAIVTARKLRLSSVSLANDTSEGKIVAQALDRVAERDGLDKAHRRQLREVMKFFERLIDGLGFCLSEEGDLLSQWRGYAQDGAGVAIGFSRGYLDWLVARPRTDDVAGITLARVKYDPSDHETEVEPTYREAKQFMADAARTPGLRGLLDTRTEEELEKDRKVIKDAQERLHFTLMQLFPKLYLLKSPAFREEKEWRLLSPSLVGGETDTLYQPKPDRLCPCRDHELLELTKQPITEVILGPKHLTPPKIIEGFLRQQGFGTVNVTSSSASYR